MPTAQGWQQVAGKPYFFNSATGQYWAPEQSVDTTPSSQAGGGEGGASTDVSGTPSSSTGAWGIQTGTLGRSVPITSGDAVAAPSDWLSQYSIGNTGILAPGATPQQVGGNFTGKGWLSTTPFDVQSYNVAPEEGLLSQLKGGLGVIGLALGAGELSGLLGGGGGLSGLTASVGDLPLAADVGAGALGGAEAINAASPFVGDLPIDSALASGGASGFSQFVGDLPLATDTLMPPPILDTGGVPMMPAAVAETPAALASQGLVQTAPGVFEQASSIGLPLASAEAGASVAAPEAGATAVAPASVASEVVPFVGDLPLASNSFASTLSSISESAPLGETFSVGSPTASSLSGSLDWFQSPESAALNAAEDTSIEDSLVKKFGLEGAKQFLKDNKNLILPAVSMGASLLAKPKVPNLSTLEGLAANVAGGSSAATAAANALIPSVSTGVLPAGAQAQVDQAVNDATGAIRAKYAQLGLSGSTMESQEISAAQSRGKEMAFSMANSLTQTGLAAAGLATSENMSAAQIYDRIMQVQLQQDQALQQALANFASASALGGGLSAVADKLSK